MSKKTINVVPIKERWRVYTAGAKRAALVTGTEAAAVDRGIQMAKNSRGELIVFRKDGSVRTMDSYNRDPLPPKS